MESLENERIDTEKLKMVPAVTDFAEEIFNALNDNITKYLSFYTPETIDDTLSFLRSNEESVKNGDGIAFSVFTKEGDFVGNCGVSDLDSETPVLGLRVSENYQSGGYGTEMIQALVRWLFENFEQDELLYEVAEANEASINLVKNHLKKDPNEGPYEGPYDEEQSNSGKVLRVVKYKIYRSDFQK